MQRHTAAWHRRVRLPERPHTRLCSSPRLNPVLSPGTAEASTSIISTGGRWRGDASASCACGALFRSRGAAWVHTMSSERAQPLETGTVGGRMC